MDKEKIILSLKNIRKTYPGVVALDNFSIDFREGEVHALLGENGAGKSTLIKTITGAIRPDEGVLIIEGSEYEAMTPHLSRTLGIEAIYQDMQMFPPLSAAENIFMGEKFGRFVSQQLINEKAREIFASFNIEIPPEKTVQELSAAQAQVVSIAKAISKHARLIIMDEPTAPLTTSEVEMLFKIIGQLKEKGITIIYISHRLEEILRISDRVTVMRDGQYIQTLDMASTSRQELINLMVGRELSDNFPERTNAIGDVTLQLENVTSDYLDNISFSVRSGEVLGISGLVGSGRTETLCAVFGVDKIKSGEVLLKGREVKIRSPRQAIGLGIGIVPEDRKRLGVFLEMDVEWNISFNTIKKLCKGIFIRKSSVRQVAQKYCDILSIKTPGVNQTVKHLSGGNVMVKYVRTLNL